MAERFQTGIKELNSITGGLPAPCVVLVEGDPGSGKQLFALQCIAVGTQGKSIILTNNYPKEVQDTLDHMGVQIAANYIDCYSWLAGGESAVDSLSNLSKLLVVIEDSLKKGSLAVFDALTPLVLYNDEEAVERFLQELVAITKAKGCVLFVTIDLGSFHEDAENTFEALVDGVFFLDKQKGLRIAKLRDTKTVDKYYFYEVTDKGIRVRGKPLAPQPLPKPREEEPKPSPKKEEEPKKEEPKKEAPKPKKKKKAPAPKKEKPKEEPAPEEKGPEEPTAEPGETGGSEEPDIV